MTIHQPTWRSKAWAAFLLLFGLVTLKAGGSVLLLESARVEAGNIIFFVVYYNVLVGFGHLVVAYGFWKGLAWVRKLALAIFAGYILVDLLVLNHIMQDGLFEPRTLYAMGLRTLVWAVTFMASPKLNHKQGASS